LSSDLYLSAASSSLRVSPKGSQNFHYPSFVLRPLLVRCLVLPKSKSQGKPSFLLNLLSSVLSLSAASSSLRISPKGSLFSPLNLLSSVLSLSFLFVLRKRKSQRKPCTHVPYLVLSLVHDKSSVRETDFLLRLST
jgi:hypothetical protein